MKNKIADIKSGIQIIDIKDRNSPEIMGSFDTSGRANNIFVEGDIAYVADGDGGLQILNIKDKRNPSSIDCIPLKKVNDV